MSCAFLLGVSSAAGANTYVEAPPPAVSPAPSSVLPPSDTGVPFAVNWPFPGNPTVSAYVEVSTQNIPGQDGTLAQDFVVDFFPLGESDAFPDLFRGTSGGLPRGAWWTSRAGVYYWQVQASYRDWAADPAVGPLKYMKTPVYELTIAVPTPVAPAPASSPQQPASSAEPSPTREPLLRLSTAKSRARNLIVRRYKVKKPRVSCERTERSAFDCDVRWRSRGRPRYRSVSVFYDEGRLKVEILG